MHEAGGLMLQVAGYSSFWSAAAVASVFTAMLAVVWVVVERGWWWGRRARRILGAVTVGCGLLTLGLVFSAWYMGGQSVGSSTATGPEIRRGVKPIAELTLDDVSKHATIDDCWTLVNSETYDITRWIPQHPGGAASITKLCGTDGTKAFKTAHGNTPNPNITLRQYKLGSPALTGAIGPPPTAPAGVNVLTLKDVSQHTRPGNCWTVLDGKVYDISDLLGAPGVTLSDLEALCGVDGTELTNKPPFNGPLVKPQLTRQLIGRLG